MTGEGAGPSRRGLLLRSRLVLDSGGECRRVRFMRWTEAGGAERRTRPMHGAGEQSARQGARDVLEDGHSRLYRSSSAARALRALGSR